MLWNGDFVAKGEKGDCVALQEMGFQQSEADHNLYFFSGEVPLILVLYGYNL